MILKKLNISQNYSLKKILLNQGLKEGDIIFKENVIKEICNKIKNEKGMRNLERSLTQIVSKIALLHLTKSKFSLGKKYELGNKDTVIEFPYTVTTADVCSLLEIYEEDNPAKHMYL